MKKAAVLISVLMIFSLAFTACSGASANGDTTAENTTTAPVISDSGNITEDVFAEENTTEALQKNAQESVFYVG